MPASFLSRCRLILGFVVAVLLAGTVVLAPQTAKADAFTVADVTIDVTAQAASQAREQALGEGEVLAFNLLMRRLTEQLDHERLPQLSAEAITALVRDFSLNDERISNVRYIARMTVRFRSADVRDLLLAYDIPFAETKSKPVMVIPILDTGGGPELWTNTNAWRFAWADWLTQAEAGGLVPFVLPLGDLADLATLDVTAARAGDAARLRTLAQRYGATESLIVQARWTPSDAGTGFLDVSTTRIGVTGVGPTLASRIVKDVVEDDATFLLRAAAAVDRQVQDDWIRANRIAFDQRGIMAIVIPVEALSDWQRVKKRLNGVPIIEDQQVVMLNRTEVRINLHFIGTPEQLTRALQQADLLLYEKDSQWYLYPETGSSQPQLNVPPS